jgi:hypothetical protein
MSLSVCPIATVQASDATIWSLLADPAAYAKWWDATTDAISPTGLAQPGQLIIAHSQALGKRWKVSIRFDDIDTARRELGLTTSLPLGITILNHIIVNALDDHTSRVSFG